MLEYGKYFIIENEKEFKEDFIDLSDYTLTHKNYRWCYVPYYEPPTKFPCAYKKSHIGWQPCSIEEVKTEWNKEITEEIENLKNLLKYFNETY